MSDHLIFFDDTCPLCQRAVSHIILIDQKNIFRFSPLKGNTAKEVLGKKRDDFISENTIVLVENFKKPKKKIYIRSKALFKIYYLIGGWHKLIGFLSFFPPTITDFFYRLIAKHRHKLAFKKRVIDKDDRFLP